jgi:YD repeat-containing protein
MNKTKLFGISTVFLIGIIIETLAVIAAVQDLTYDSGNPVVNVSYDTLNRVLAKNSSSGSFNYTYDADYFGTLTNVTFANGSVAYQYDDRLRAVKEVRYIDGIRFEKGYDYDSADRVVKQQLMPGNETKVIRDAQGMVDNIIGYVNATKHNAAGNVLNRTYANGKVSNFTYDGRTGRLSRINTNSTQNLLYSYDYVGNVMMINDSTNNRAMRMGYDYIDRLLNMSLNGGQSFLYTYDAIGNMVKIVKDSSSYTKLIYDGKPVHAPAKVITGSALAQIKYFAILNSSNKSKLYEFRLINEKNVTDTTVNWTMYFGDTTNSSSSNFNLTVSQNVYVIVEHNYSSGGSYLANVTAGKLSSPSDFDKARVRFGIYPEAIYVVSRNITNTAYTLVIRNDLINTADVSWQCNNGLFSGSPITINGRSSYMVNASYNYSSSGITILNCSVSSANGNGSIKTEFGVKGIEIDNYNRSVTGNMSTISFNITNYFYPRAVNWRIISEGQTFTGTTIGISTNSSVVVSQSINYTNPGKKTVSINISSDRNLSDSLSDSFILKSVALDSYFFYNTSLTKKAFDFLVKNYWVTNLSAKWNITDPPIASSSFNLGPGEVLWVFVESDNLTQGIKAPTVNAYNGSLASSRVERFANKLLGLANYRTIVESRNNSITEAFIMSNRNPQNISWTFNTGEKKVTNTQNISINAYENIVLIVVSNYSASSVYNTSLFVNSSMYDDSAKGVIIT